MQLAHGVVESRKDISPKVWPSESWLTTAPEPTGVVESPFSTRTRPVTTLNMSSLRTPSVRIRVSLGNLTVSPPLKISCSAPSADVV